jgi:DNA polymerase V
MAGRGQNDQFPSPNLSAGCGISKETLAGARGNDEVAPKADTLTSTKVVRLPAPLADLARELAEASQGGDVSAVFTVDGKAALSVPMMAWTAACGFPSPAEDYIDRPFNELLIEHPAANFAIRIEGESMTGAGIFPGDIAIVDRAREPVDGNVILALLDGAFTVRRYRIKDGAVRLQAENPAFSDMPMPTGRRWKSGASSSAASACCDGRPDRPRRLQHGGRCCCSTRRRRMMRWRRSS